MRTRYLQFVLCTLVILAGCTAAKPRVTSVTGKTITQTVQAADERTFLASRAAGYRVAARPLQASEQQRQEFFIRWNGQALDAVRFEYRQAGLPNHVHQQNFQISGEQSHTFIIDGQAYAAGGAITAWRVTLLRNEQAVAQKQSALWQ